MDWVKQYKYAEDARYGMISLLFSCCVHLYKIVFIGYEVNMGINIEFA